MLVEYGIPISIAVGTVVGVLVAPRTLDPLIGTAVLTLPMGLFLYSLIQP